MLISIVLAFLGVPLWLIIGGLLLALWNRSQVKKQPGVFPIKVRSEPDPDSEKEPKWPRMAGYAQWIHDVLIVRNGLGLMMTTPYGIKAVEGSAQDADLEKEKGLGEHPKVIRARLDDGSIIQFAVGDVHPTLAPERFQVDKLDE